MSALKSFITGKPSSSSSSGGGGSINGVPNIGVGGGMAGGGGGGGGDGSVNVVDGGQPDLVRAWEIEAREQRIRAQMSEQAHVYDTNRMFTYLKQMGASPKQKVNTVDQMLIFCNSLCKERHAAEEDSRLKSHKLGEANAEIKFLRSDVKDALNDVRQAQIETENYRRKYKENKEKLEKADFRRDDAVAKVTRQMKEAAAAHIVDKQQSEAQLRMQLGVLESQIHRLQGEHAAALKQLEEKHANVLKDVAATHEVAQKSLHDDKEREIDEIIDAHEAETDILKEKVRELAADLISQTDDFRPATDQALRIKLLDLRNRIKNITVPNNLHLRIESSGGSGEGGDGATTASATHQLPPDLDPTGFVSRHGSRDLQYILRGLVWNVLIDAFFSAPFGFGFLGPDPQRNPGRQQLMEIHRAWSRLYEGQQPYRYTYDNDEFAMYKRDYNANKLRSAVFQSFLPVVFPEKAAARQQQMMGGPGQSSDHQTQQTLTLNQLPPLPTAQQSQHQPGAALWPGQFQAFQPGGGQAPPPYSSSSPPPPPPRRGGGGSVSGGPEPGVAIWHRQHCESVVASIKQLLDRITGYATRPDALEAVPAIVNLAAELGIEFGVQRAQVWLVMPKRNDLVQAGPEYQDCLGGTSDNNDKDHGRDLKVDLMVSPGIVRIGDGRGDLSIRKALVSCEVIPYS
ncbi:hypothetical protein Sste5346_001099 [Sporothrix stenoceras]|uniref:Uncharacterized protein n=1 Tax=Sporothrix stenoceras TaxID=5173 RepID=A0ABR3ZR88_9PEZI